MTRVTLVKARQRNQRTTVMQSDPEHIMPDGSPAALHAANSEEVVAQEEQQVETRELGRLRIPNRSKNGTGMPSPPQQAAMLQPPVYALPVKKKSWGKAVASAAKRKMKRAAISTGVFAGRVFSVFSRKKKTNTLLESPVMRGKGSSIVVPFDSTNYQSDGDWAKIGPARKKGDRRVGALRDDSTLPNETHHDTNVRRRDGWHSPTGRVARSPGGETTDPENDRPSYRSGSHESSPVDRVSPRHSPPQRPSRVVKEAAVHDSFDVTSPAQKVRDHEVANRSRNASRPSRLADRAWERDSY